MEQTSFPETAQSPGGAHVGVPFGCFFSVLSCLPWERSRKSVHLSLMFRALQAGLPCLSIPHSLQHTPPLMPGSCASSPTRLLPWQTPYHIPAWSLGTQGRTGQSLWIMCSGLLVCTVLLPLWTTVPDLIRWDIQVHPSWIVYPTDADQELCRSERT